MTLNFTEDLYYPFSDKVRFFKILEFFKIFIAIRYLSPSFFLSCIWLHMIEIVLANQECLTILTHRLSLNAISGKKILKVLL